MKHILFPFRYVNSWLFSSGSPVTLGVFRIVICALAFINLAMIAIDFGDWYTEAGFIPRHVHANYTQDLMRYSGEYELAFPVPRINLLYGVESDWIVAGFYVLVMAAALFAMVGLWTRFWTIVLAIGVITLHHRNLMILHGGDTAMRQFLIILAFAPSGAACSLDRFIAVWRGKALKEPVAVPLWPQRLLQVQIAVLYFTAVWWKWQGTHWRDGTATWYISQLREFNRFWVPEIFERQPFLGITTYATLITELALATLVFYRPFRKWVLIAGLLMHAYIEYRFNIPMFAFIVTSAYLCFYDGEETAAWAKRLGQKFKRIHLTVFAPAGFRLSGPKGDAIQNLDALGVIEYKTGERSEWEAVTASGKKRNPFLATGQRSLGAWPLVTVWDKLLRKALDPIPVEIDPAPEPERLAVKRGGKR